MFPVFQIGLRAANVGLAVAILALTSSSFSPILLTKQTNYLKGDGFVVHHVSTDKFPVISSPSL